MSVSGMTGFGRAEGEHGDVRWLWEARSVNGRGLDLKVRVPQGYDAVEPLVREAAQARFKRGSVQVGLTLQRRDTGSSAKLDLAFIQSLVNASKPFVASGDVALPRWDGLLTIRGAFRTDDDEAPEQTDQAALVAALARGAVAALDLLGEARQREGRMLAGVLSGLVDRIEGLVMMARAEVGAAPDAQIARLKSRIAQLAPDVTVDPQRFAQEAALIAARADVQEELDRLSAHAAEARELLAKPEPAGRRLDFLSQELTREANTLTSKSGELALTRVGLDLKTAIDQFKEQAANVE